MFLVSSYSCLCPIHRSLGVEGWGYIHTYTILILYVKQLTFSWNHSDIVILSSNLRQLNCAMRHAYCANVSVLWKLIHLYLILTGKRLAVACCKIIKPTPWKYLKEVFSMYNLNNIWAIFHTVLLHHSVNKTCETDNLAWNHTKTFSVSHMEWTIEWK